MTTLRASRSASRRLLPGHGQASRFAETALPGVDPVERRARRLLWTRFRAEQRARFGLRDGLGLAGAALILALMISATLAPRANVLDATGSSPATQPVAVQTVDVTPASNGDAVRLRG